MINIVLVEPEIPQNTGNIARTCAATGMRLHVIEPIGFEISDRTVRRAGLDYWQYLDITIYKNYDEFLSKNSGDFYYCTTKGKNIYSDADLSSDNLYLLFGKETKGLPEPLLKDNYDKCIRIPMINDARSLNLSNSVAIIGYEALRQQGFWQLKTEGSLTTL
ncbi:MAG: tRNA (uridine(34)/cytosine(34)/5-carboxymethylaminomethyluridine(34)-2'-O)-methyltransferase TrmL [Clostridia bacterium]|nr:tRNA (uridine(34)/cytosine(34)/5-carboxymethylaminomethyluridine(34)-2'-O)-methyltransferase TrmL [Clostridia bacterium]